MQEYWDLYDRDRRPLGRVHLRGTPLPPDTYHVVVHLCIFNERGEMLIQRRVGDKDTFPDYWDLSVGGSARAERTAKLLLYENARKNLA